MSATKQEQYAAGLQALGYVEQESVSRKYRMFCKPLAGSVTYFFLGKSGSVRYNSFKRITGAVSVSAKTKAVILSKVAQPKEPS